MQDTFARLTRYHNHFHINLNPLSCHHIAAVVAPLLLLLLLFPSLPTFEPLTYLLSCLGVEVDHRECVHDLFAPLPRPLAIPFLFQGSARRLHQQQADNFYHQYYYTSFVLPVFKGAWFEFPRTKALCRWFNHTPPSLQTLTIPPFS